MTNLVEPRQRFDSTSAAGAMFMPKSPRACLSDSCSSVSEPQLSRCSRSKLSLVRNGRRIKRRPACLYCKGNAPELRCAELRRLSGFTWEQLARLFKVSRRSLHFWASGKAMTPMNEEHLQRLLAAVRKVDRGSASANRAVLLVARNDGTLPFDLLAEGQYERVVSLLHSGEAFARPRPPQLSGEAKAARAPRRPEELVDALQDRVHRERGIARAANSVKVRSGR